MSQSRRRAADSRVSEWTGLDVGDGTDPDVEPHSNGSVHPTEHVNGADDANGRVSQPIEADRAAPGVTAMPGRRRSHRSVGQDWFRSDAGSLARPLVGVVTMLLAVLALFVEPVLSVVLLLVPTLLVVAERCRRDAVTVLTVVHHPPRRHPIRASSSARSAAPAARRCSSGMAAAWWWAPCAPAPRRRRGTGIPACPARVPSFSGDGDGQLRRRVRPADRPSMSPCRPIASVLYLVALLGVLASRRGRHPDASAAGHVAPPARRSRRCRSRSSASCSSGATT